MSKVEFTNTIATWGLIIAIIGVLVMIAQLAVAIHALPPRTLPVKADEVEARQCLLP